MTTYADKSECPECEGHGTWVEEWPEFYTGDQVKAERKCNKCNGTGYLCADCGAAMAYALGVWRCGAGAGGGEGMTKSPVQTGDLLLLPRVVVELHRAITSPHRAIETARGIS